MHLQAKWKDFIWTGVAIASILGPELSAHVTGEDFWEMFAAAHELRRVSCVSPFEFFEWRSL
jgi:hypothetical protein